MSYLLEYDGDGKLFPVIYPVSNIDVDKVACTIRYVQSNLRVVNRTFSSHSELIQFVNWLNYNNETATV